jgi:ATP-dependent protease ClpP protease subunit
MKLKLMIGLTIIALAAGIGLSSNKSQAAAPKTDSVSLAGDNTLVLRGEVNGENVSQVLTKAKELDAALSGVKEKFGAKKHLVLFIDSPGGSIQAGLELIEGLKGLDRPVDTVVSFAASMAWQIVQNLDERLILKNGVMMSHHARGEAQGEFGGSQHTQMEARQQLWLDRVKELDEQTVKRTNGKQTYESYTKEYDHEMWLTGTKSVAEGYSDKIVLAKCDKTLTGVTTNHISFLGMDIAYDLDNCPLNSNPGNVRVGQIGGGKGPTADVNPELAEQIKKQFLTTYESKMRQVIPMYW